MASPAACAGKKHSKMAETRGLRSASVMLRGPALMSRRMMGADGGAGRERTSKRVNLCHLLSVLCPSLASLRSFQPVSLFISCSVCLQMTHVSSMHAYPRSLTDKMPKKVKSREMAKTESRKIIKWHKIVHCHGLVGLRQHPSLTFFSLFILHQSLCTIPLTMTSERRSP